MLSKLQIFLLITSSAAITSYSFAESPNNEKKSIYIAADIGFTDHVLDADGFDSDSGNDSGYGASIGYYINQNFSIGIGYIDYGEATIATVNDPILGKVDFNTTATSLLFFGTFSTESPNQNRNNNWNIFANVGLADSDFDLKVEALGRSAELTSESKIGLWGGIGASYDLSKGFLATIEASWQVFDIDGGPIADSIGVSKLDVQLAKYGIGIKYRF